MGGGTWSAKRWCAEHGKSQRAVYICTGGNRCEDCPLPGQKATWKAGGSLKGRPRWYPSCAKGHPGSVCSTAKRLCEDCGVVQASFGLPPKPRAKPKPAGVSNNKKRWCGRCAVPVAHTGAVRTCKPRTCEECRNQASFGRVAAVRKPGEHMLRWCSSCARARPTGARQVCDRQGKLLRSIATLERRVSGRMGQSPSDSEEEAGEDADSGEDSHGR